jgi:hypothetical protein
MYTAVAKTNAQLKGEYKVDILDDKGQLIEEGEWFPNFITQTGLFYPKQYSFADCFRFLSVGGGVSPTANSMTTTGLSAGSSTEIAAVDSASKLNSHNQSIRYMSKDQYHVPLADDGIAGCGTISTPKGPIMFRAWELPSGNNVASVSQTFREFMVSPNSGVTGLDSYASGNGYSGRLAFSRVIKNITIPQYSKAIVTFRLSLFYDQTGVKTFSSGTFDTGSANVEDDTYDLMGAWSNLSGYYKQVYHGLRLVDNFGATFAPKYGDPLEPSRADSNKVVSWISPDYSQFCVQATGGFQSSESSAYSSDGLCKTFTPDFQGIKSTRASITDSSYYDTGDIDLENFDGNSTSENVIANIRSHEVKAPIASNYRTETSNIDFRTADSTYLANARIIATPGVSGYKSDEISLGDKRNLSSLTTELPYTFNTGNRKQTMSKKMFFPAAQNFGYNSRMASMVMAYNNNGTYYPFMDSLFFDSSGRSIPMHYREVTGINFSENGSGVYSASIVKDAETDKTGFLIATGDISGGSVTGYSGYQTLYVLADHTTGTNTPSSTGTTYWPYVGPSYETNLSYGYVNFTGVNKNTINEPIQDTAKYFSTEQVMDYIRFTPLTNTNGYSGNVFSHIEQDKTINSNVMNGFFLSTGQIAEVLAGSGEMKSYIEQEWFTYSGTPSGSLSLSGDFGSLSIPLNDFISTEQLQIYTGDSLKAFSFKRLNGVFEDYEATLNLANRLSGSGINENSLISGQFDLSGDSGIPLSLVYISGHVNNPESSDEQFLLQGNFETGFVTTKFAHPSGRFEHGEAFRLMPNHGSGNYSTNVYSAGVIGGEYPALSYNNTLEVFYDFSWSAACGDVGSPCVNPS